MLNDDVEIVRQYSAIFFGQETRMEPELLHLGEEDASGKTSDVRNTITNMSRKSAVGSSNDFAESIATDLSGGDQTAKGEEECTDVEDTVDRIGGMNVQHTMNGFIDIINRVRTGEEFVNMRYVTGIMTTRKTDE